MNWDQVSLSITRETSPYHSSTSTKRYCRHNAFWLNMFVLQAYGLSRHCHVAGRDWILFHHSGEPDFTDLWFNFKVTCTTSSDSVFVFCIQSLMSDSTIMKIKQTCFLMNGIYQNCSS
ncbi:hypothetical protein TNCV_2590791 [Trichonephila clavipes]|nr:hypothetical protein TNCV_2590791 [Trichonephila clavipes]